ncbi:unnamed protein product [Rotaria sordida]|uniref:Kinesin light chain n=1 Tax=Rotaria sordida TaxID=392033 RepID=A0A815GNQ0_9BILA|nr:unnamed protein product [Rotaria sordida]CAF1597572.1 unnamed protein product [Rotaria sordida]
MDEKKSPPTASGSFSFISSSVTTNKWKNSSSVPSSTSDGDGTATVSSKKTKRTERDTVLSRPVRRVLQNFLLIWLDAAFDESKENYKESIQHLRHIVASITIFMDADQCVDFLSDIEDEKVFMIVSGTLGQHIIPEIQVCPQLASIYVFCDNQSIHEYWIKTIPKVKDVYTQIEAICEVLKIDCEHCDQDMIPISYHGIDALFMYTQLLKEALLEIEDDDTKSIKELVEYYRLQGNASEKTLEKIEREYRNHTPIWWYTGPYFIYSMLNHGLRQMDVDIILKMGFFIRHLHQDITELHREQQQSNKAAMPSKFEVFRGQGLSMEAFEKMKKTKGGLMSFNNFLSTSRDREISLQSYARLAAFNENSVGILFVMNIDTAICTASSTPFVNVKNVGFYDDQEEEILFSTHTIFRIDRIERIEDQHTDRLWQKTLPPNHPDLATSYNGIGAVYDNMGEYSEALSSYERSLEIRKIALPPNHPDLAAPYNNIGNVYKNMGEYSKALSSYEVSLEIRKILLPPNHVDLAASYNNIGAVYYNMGEYSEALSSYERSLEIQKIALPPNHPDLASSYGNIGLVYDNLDEYSKALSSYERSLEIQKIALPPNHPLLAASYNNIGMVYDNMGEYSKALSSHEQALHIDQKALPSNHPDLASDYNNIGNVYDSMGEYSKALLSYERSLEIRKIALPPNHPDFAQSYNNIGNAYENMSEYSKALRYYEKAQDIWKKSLPPTHPHIALVKSNIEDVKKKM